MCDCSNENITAQIVFLLKSEDALHGKKVNKLIEIKVAPFRAQ